jgi:hypothetical protein
MYTEYEAAKATHTKIIIKGDDPPSSPKTGWLLTGG